jgi:hypothetical protein
MKTYDITYASKSIFKKRALLIFSTIFTIVVLLTASGCTKIDKDSPPRFVFPQLTTESATNITTTTVTTGGNITTDGGSAITARGVCWRSTANPSIATTDSTSVDGSGTGQFVSNITGLVAGKEYHIRAYATNADGTAYGQDITFTTASE